MDDFLDKIPPSHESAKAVHWPTAALSEIVDHLVDHHHGYLREELPRLADLANRLAASPGATRQGVAALVQCFRGLHADLEPHLMKEENILFPMITRSQSDEDMPTLLCGSLQSPIRMMRFEHDEVMGLLARIRELDASLRSDATLPQDLVEFLDRLEALELDLRHHIHEENEILFTRVTEEEEKAARNEP